MSWIMGAIELGLSAGSTLFNIGQSMRNQRKAREQRREALRQRVAGLQTQAANYSGDAQAMLGHVLGEKGESGERSGGLMYHREGVLSDLNDFYDQSRGQMRNLFNYAGMTGPRSQVLMNQLEANRQEDIADFNTQFNDQLMSASRDVITTSYNAYDALRESQQGFKEAKGVDKSGTVWGYSPASGRLALRYTTREDLEDSAKSIFENNSEAIKGAMEFIGNTQELSEAFESEEQFASLLEERGVADSYTEARALARAASGATLEDSDIEALGIAREYSEVVDGEDGKYLVTYELDNDALSQMLREQFEAYAEGKDIEGLDFEDMAGEGSAKEVSRTKLVRNEVKNENEGTQGQGRGSHETRRESSRERSSSKTGSGHDEGKGRTDRPSGGQGVNVEY